MTEYTDLQLLLFHVRKEYCGGNAAELARKIGKDGTYVNRLFYPVGKKGGKGIGLEIMKACSEVFKLPPGFWEGKPDRRLNQTSIIGITATPKSGFQSLLLDECHTTASGGPSTEFGSLSTPSWPFKAVSQEQYWLLDDEQKADIEKYVLLQVKSREPPEKQAAPATKSDNVQAA